MGLVSLVSSAAPACGDGRVSTDEFGDTDGTGDPPADEVRTGLALERKVDVLFVIDDTASMAGAQSRLAASAEALIAAIGSETDVRVGFTDTDKGHLLCDAPAATAGQLRASSCWDRSASFVAEPPGTGSGFEQACAAHCPADIGVGLRTRATRTAEDDTPRPRPWLERRAGRTNLPPGIDFAQAFACMAPQGLRGCDYPAPLESMEQALARAQAPGDAQFGFVREDAALVVVFVTDGVDCSTNAVHEGQVFDPRLPIPDRTYWEDPQAEGPSPAVCWNAGVRCEGDGPTYPTCEAADFDPRGDVLRPWLDPEADAILRPIDGYGDRLVPLEWAAQAFDSELEVLIVVLGGVPEGHADGGPPIVYADAADPTQQIEYGVGPGCARPDGGLAAPPPVRLRELAERYDGDERPHLYSVCADSYAPDFSRLGASIYAMFSPSCAQRCQQDADPERPGLQVAMTLQREDSRSGRVDPVPPCDPGGALPSGADECYRIVGIEYAPTGVVRSTTLDGELDATARIDPSCIGEGANTEIRLVRGPGTAPRTAHYAMFAPPAEDPEATCPLGGP